MLDVLVQHLDENMMACANLCLQYYTWQMLRGLEYLHSRRYKASLIRLAQLKLLNFLSAKL